MTFGVPKTKLYSFDYEGAEDLSDEFHPGAAHGFEAAYEAYCNLYNSPVRFDLVEYIKDLDKANIRDLDLSECPGVDLKTELSFDLIPLAATLKNNTYFKGLEIRKVEHKEAANAIATILTENRTLTRVVCVNCTSEVSDLLGQAIQQNPYNKIRILDLTGNKFGIKAVDALAAGLQNCPHVIEVVNLNNVGMNASGLQALINTWNINWSLRWGWKNSTF